VCAGSMTLTLSAKGVMSKWFYTYDTSYVIVGVPPSGVINGPCTYGSTWGANKTTSQIWILNANCAFSLKKLTSAQSSGVDGASADSSSSGSSTGIIIIAACAGVAVVALAVAGVVFWRKKAADPTSRDEALL